MKKERNIQVAQQLMDDFLNRTGISDPAGNSRQRYLWTDAFAVQACFALSHLSDNENYHQHAISLIENVHAVLGRHRQDDPREGWLSGLPEEEGKLHPTINGLRIGKDLPDRPGKNVFDRGSEWNRDGQYFHYLTRWFNALLQAFNETNEKNYAIWAAELIEAGEKFVVKETGDIRMVWKMNVDLTETMVESMGAHDPLEGLICVNSAIDTLPESKSELENFKEDLEIICRNMNWVTDDALGIGGLLLNTTRAAEMKLKGKMLPAAIRPESLYLDSLAGLQAYSKHVYNPNAAARSRLAFRECGLCLGFRTLHGLKSQFGELDINFNKLEEYHSVIDEIENFWMDPSNQKATTWSEHLDINAVTLASTLLARDYPRAFSPEPG